MSYTLLPISVTVPAGATSGPMVPISIPGDLATVSWVKISNLSPFLLQLNNLNGGTEWLEPSLVAAYPVPGLSTAIQATPYNEYGTAASNALSSVIAVTWYGYGEQPSGTFPVSLAGLTNLGNNLNTSINTPNSLEQDVLTPFVLFGLVATKDGSIANKLDVTTGVALLRQTDQSLGRVAPVATSFTTVQVSSTYYLDLNPDGSWSFATTHSAVSNYLTIAQVTTDGSGNISTVTDERPLNAVVLPTATGEVHIPASVLRIGPSVSGQECYFFYNAGADRFEIGVPFTGGAAQGVNFATWNGSSAVVPFSVGGNFGTASTYISSTGAVGQVAGQASAGSFGVPVIVAQAIRTHVTATTQQTIISYTAPASGLYEVSLYFYLNNGTSGQTVTAAANTTDPDTSTGGGSYFTTNAGAVTILGNSNTVVNGSYPCYVMPVTAKASTTITIVYQDRGGTPNDYVTAMIKRLS